MCKYSNFDPKFFIDIGFGHKKPDKIRTIVGKITAIGFITAVEMAALRADASDFDAPRHFCSTTPTTTIPADISESFINRIERRKSQNKIGAFAMLKYSVLLAAEAANVV